MNKSTKERIVENAIFLFNEQGYYNTSLRDIADKTKISIGNLTYHFNKKEDLISFIIQDLQESYPLKEAENLSSEQLVDFLANSIMKAESNRQENSFYYENLNQFATEYDSVNNQIKEFEKYLFNSFNKIFHLLQEQNIFYSDLSNEQFISFTHLFVSLLVYWDHKVSLKNNNLVPNFTLSQILINSLLTITHPSKKSCFTKHLK